jgi:hypothetical protein
MPDALTPLFYLTPYLLLLAAMLAQPAAIIPIADE